MYRFTADENGKIWIALSTGETTATFSVYARDGRTFAPGETVVYSDEAMQRLIAGILAPFGIEQVPIRAEPT